MSLELQSRILTLTGLQAAWCRDDWRLPEHGVDDAVLAHLGEAFTTVVVESSGPAGRGSLVSFAVGNGAACAVMAEDGTLKAGRVIPIDQLVADLAIDVGCAGAQSAPESAVVDDSTLAVLAAIFVAGPEPVTDAAARKAIASISADANADAVLAELHEHGLLTAAGGAAGAVVPGAAVEADGALRAAVSGERLQITVGELRSEGLVVGRSGRFIGPRRSRFAVLKSSASDQTLLARGGDAVLLEGALTGLVCGTGVPETPVVSRPIEGDGASVAPMLITDAESLAALPARVADVLAEPAWSLYGTRDDPRGRLTFGVCAAEGLAVGWTLDPGGLGLAGMPLADVPRWVTGRAEVAVEGGPCDAVAMGDELPAMSRSDLLAALPAGEPEARVRTRLVVHRCAEPASGGQQVESAAWLGRGSAGSWWISDTTAELWQAEPGTAAAVERWLRLQLGQPEPL